MILPCSVNGNIIVLVTVMIPVIAIANEIIGVARAMGITQARVRLMLQARAIPIVVAARSTPAPSELRPLADAGKNAAM